MLLHVNRMHNVYVIIAIHDSITSRFISHKNIVNFSIQASPASFRFYHCTLWRIFLSFRKFTIDLIQTQEWPSVLDHFTKVTS